MAGPINLKLLTDFFNKIDPLRHAALRVADGRFRGKAEFER